MTISSDPAATGQLPPAWVTKFNRVTESTAVEIEICANETKRVLELRHGRRSARPRCSLYLVLWDAEAPGHALPGDDTCPESQ